jgi:hypothetical protein
MILDIMLHMNNTIDLVGFTVVSARVVHHFECYLRILWSVHPPTCTERTMVQHTILSKMFPKHDMFQLFHGQPLFSIHSNENLFHPIQRGYNRLQPQRPARRTSSTYQRDLRNVSLVSKCFSLIATELLLTRPCLRLDRAHQPVSQYRLHPRQAEKATTLRSTTAKPANDKCTCSYWSSANYGKDVMQLNMLFSKLPNLDTLLHGWIIISKPKLSSLE